MLAKIGFADKICFMEEMPNDPNPNPEPEIQWDGYINSFTYTEHRHITGPNTQIIRREYNDGTIGIRDKDGTAITLSPADLPPNFDYPWLSQAE